jgi:hypothetical protein
LKIHSGIWFKLSQRFARDDCSADNLKYLDDTVFIGAMCQYDTGHHCRNRYDNSRDTDEQLAVQQSS